MDKIIRIMVLYAVLFFTFVNTPVLATAPDLRLEDKSIPQIVAHFFPENPKTMTAIFMAESSLNEEAVNYNCHAYKNGHKYSDSCKMLGIDPGKAWSVDCGISQINVKGNTCPKELFNPVTNLSRAVEKYEKEGLNAWVVYKNKTYKKFL